jgi:hypothetical protein
VDVIAKWVNRMGLETRVGRRVPYCGLTTDVNWQRESGRTSVGVYSLADAEVMRASRALDGAIVARKCCESCV